MGLTTGRAPKRRRLLASAAVAATAALVAAGCGSSGSTGSSTNTSASSSGSSSTSSGSTGGSSSGVTQINFWSWDPGMAAVVAAYNKSHPSVHVNLTSLSPEYPKLLAALKAGNPPDAAQVEYEALPEFISTGDLVNLTSAGFAKYQSDYAPWAWAQVHEGSAMYAIPEDSGPMLMFYRKDVFKKYGITVPTTWAEFAKDAQLLHQKDPTEYLTDFAGASDPSWFLGLMWQDGAHWFGTSGQKWTVSIDGPQSTTVSNYWQQLIDEKAVSTQPDFSPQWFKGLADGKIATVIQGGWMADLIEEEAPHTSGDWGVAYPPQWTAAGAADANSGGSTNVVFTASKHKAQTEAFLQWLDASDAGWNLLYKDVHLVPTYLPAYSLASVNSPLAFFSNANVGAMLGKASKEVDENFVWGPTTETVFTDAGDDYSSVLEGHGTLSSVLPSLQKQAIASLKAANYPVAG